MKSWRSLVFLPLFFFVMVSGRLFAAPVDTQQVPENLRPWIDWTLHGHESERCPFMNSRGNDRICAWAGRLDLSIEEKQGSFTQSWTLYTDDWIPLPGDAKRWPQNVKVDGQAAAVVFHDDQPSLFLKKGSHTLSGAYLWDTIPESFQISPSVGMLKLVLKGKPIDFPQLDEDGLLWLEKESEAGNGEERLDVRVNRKVNDDIPLILTTSIKLDASGKAREVTLGKALPENFILMSVDSPIPARVENDGRLKVQVRAGSWDIEIKARHVGPVTALSLPDGEAPLAPEEVWVFEAHNNLRMVTVEGVPSVDPQQTTLPDDWKSLPAYRIRPNETMKLVERRRGDSDPGPDQLTLYRRLWLDFDGTGYSVQDSLSGTMNRSDRLEMNAPVILGRVSIDGQDQFITTLEGEKSAGVEIRQGRLNVNADSRIPGLLRHIPALGWNHDFQRVSGELKLPPGWTLLAVNGADEVPGTWISRWNLLNIFMVLILSLIFSRLWGMKWGMFALAALVLTYTEPHAPQWVWIFLLAGCALLRLLKSGIFRSLARIYVGVNLVVLVMIVLPFMVRQLRQGMYPVLEHSYSYMDSQGGIVPTQSQNVTGGMGGGMTPPALTNVDANQPMPVEEPSDFVGRRDEDAKRGFFKAQKVKEKTVEDREKVLHEIAGEQRERKSDRFQEAQSISTLSGKQQQNIDNLIQNRPGTKIQTGPGMPHWSWNSFRLTWNGPVEKSQDLRLWLLSPAANFLLAVLRVILLSLLVFCVLGLPKNFWPRFLGSRKTALAAFFLLALAWAPAARADFPPQPLLDELRDKILQNPECFPECASVSRMQLTVTGTQLRALLEISAQAVTALPLPGSFEEWTPATVSVDGRPSATLHRDEEAQLLWIQLTPGVHQVMIEGPLPDRSSVQIALPLKPHQISAQVSGWTLEGRLDDGLAADNLQLIRLEGMTSELSAAKRTILPPFFSVERHLMLGLVWEVQTTVRRLTPLGTAFVGEVPLLPGESVTDADVQVKQGKVQVSMGPSAETFEWHSVLSETDRLVLQAPESTSMTEVWILELNPVWHMKAEGIPPVHPENLARRWPREWRPWPGEQLTLSISRPAGVPGQTLTIDRSLLAVRPGLRFTESSLELMIRSSLGGQHELTLPEGAVLQSVQINGIVQPIRQEGLKVSLPIVPGTQRVNLNWQQPLALKTFFRTPEVKLGAPSVNSEIQVYMPVNRWLLFTGGLRVGPAVLFWSLLAVLLLAAFGLGRVGYTPLRTYHWLLLGLGLTQVPIWASIIVAAWLLALGWRERKPMAGKISFDLFQIFLVIWTAAALGVVFLSIKQGLLGLPDMQIAGNGSSATFLRWYQDRAGETLARVWAVSVPLFCYRLAMLAWALWLAFALLRWLRWAWKSWTSETGWKSLRGPKPVSPQS